MLYGVLLGASALLGGCETAQHAARTEEAVAQREAMIQRKIEEPIRNLKPYGDVVQYLDHQYVSLAPVKREVESASSSKSSLKCRIEIATEQPISILEAAQIVSRECKVPVRVTQDALQYIASNGLNQLTAMQGAGAMGGPAGMGGAPIVGAIGGPAAMGGPGAYGQQAGRRAYDSTLIDINYSGEGDGFLDMLTARAGGLAWRKDDSGVYRIYAMDTRSFSIASLASDESTMNSNFQSGTTMTTGASTTGTAGGSGSGSQGSSGQGTSTTMQATAVKLKADLWQDIQNTLTTLAGDKNAVVSRATSSVTVKGTIDTLDSVSKYIEFQNKRLKKFVSFNIKVYSVVNKNNDAAGVNWNAVYGTLTGKFGMTLGGSAFAAPATAVNAGFSVLKTSGSPWAGTEAIVSALNEQGRAHLEREQALPTLNFQPVATQVGTQRGYVAGITTTQTAQVGSQTSIQMGMINVGFSLSLFPYVQDNNEILAHFNLNLSNLDSIRTVKQDGSTAEAPNINLPLNTVQKVRISPGDTIMLTGINQTDDSVSRTGTGWNWNWVLGGGVDAQRARSSLVVLITPVLMD